MSAKKNVMVFIDWFLPAYKAGGPIQSVNNIISHLQDEFYFYVVTSNKDLGENEALNNIAHNQWIEKGSYSVIYLDDNHQKGKFYLDFYYEKKIEFIYLNSLFSKKFSLLPLSVFRSLHVPIVLSPRGMLGQGALKIKPLKKKLFLLFFKLLNVQKRVIWHATSQFEKNEIEENFGGQLDIRIAANLSKKMGVYKPKSKIENELNVFFLSRISYKKNLIQALNWLNLVNKNVFMKFTIIGPIEENNYWIDCQKIINNLNKNIKVHYIGAVPNNQLDEILEDQHVLLLPTFHENFGHVIMESWQYGCPVIISDQTPWKNLQEKQIGFDFALDEDNNFVESLNKFSTMDEKSFYLWSKSSFDFAKAFTENLELIENTKKLFLK